jgi:hypothetical protein
MRLPFTLNKILTDRHLELTNAFSSRSWALPETSFVSEVDHYSKRLRILKPKAEVPALIPAVEPQHSEEIALRIGSALDLASLAERADPMIRPIILYYSCAHLVGAYGRAYLSWENDKRGHGLTCRHKSREVESTEVSCEHRGLFAKTAASLFLYTGEVTPFTSIVTFASSPTQWTGAGEYLENFGINEVGAPLGTLKLSEISAFDYSARLRTVRVHHGFHKFRGLPSTALLMDIIVLFLAGSMARYDILGWKSVQEGRSNPFRSLFEETYERYITFGMDAILRGIENPFNGPGDRLIRSQPSPYSHDDHSRFATDPNYS